MDTKSAPYSLLRTVHAWGGALLGLWVLVVSVSGTLLVWKQDYLRATIPEARERFEPTVEALAAVAGTIEKRFGADNIVLIDFATADFALSRVTMTDDRYTYVDARGRVVTEWVLNDRWEEWLFDLHHRLLLGNKGLIWSGLAALIAILLVIAGLATYWPLRMGLRQGIWPKNFARAQLLRAHRNIGVVEALLLLMSLATGAILAFPDQSQRLLLEPFRGEDYSLDFGEHLDDISGPGTGDWLPAMQRALDSLPGSRIRSVQVPNSFSPQRIIGLQQQGDWNSLGISKIYIDAEGGQMDVRMDLRAQRLPERMYNAVYPLHTGRLDFLPYKLLLTLSGLLAAAISVFGLSSFAKSRARL
jgi:uncharacterized iron-regulated membrane protein